MTLRFDKDRRLFLECFPGFKTFQTFKDNPNIKSDINLIRQVSVDGDSYPVGDFDFSKKIIDLNIISGLEKLNNRGAGIYLTINETDGTGRKKENITRVRACFADFDGIELPKKFDPDPSMIIETSLGKYHVYYLTEDTPIQGFTQLQKSIAHKFNSDPVVHDLPRIMRVPGFYHMKKEPFLTKIISYTGSKFSYRLLNEMFPPKPVKQWSAPKYQKNNSNPNEGYKGDYGANKGGRNHHVMSRIGGMMKRGLSWSEIESEAFKEAMACNPPLSETETRHIIKSARRYC